MIGIGGGHESLGLHGEKIVLTHDARNAFVIYQHPAAPQLGRHAPIAITTSVLQRDLLDCGPYLHALFQRNLLLQGAVEAGPANPGQLTHALDTQAALHRHHFLDLVVDAVSPEPLPFWRRASTFCKAPSKNSASSVFSASTRFKSRTSLRSWRMAEVGVPSCPASSCRCQW